MPDRPTPSLRQRAYDLVAQELRDWQASTGHAGDVASAIENLIEVVVTHRLREPLSVPDRLEEIAEELRTLENVVMTVPPGPHAPATIVEWVAQCIRQTEGG